jgi:hypothetical protein
MLKDKSEQRYYGRKQKDISLSACLTNEIYIPWLEQRDVKITLRLDEMECDAQEIRELLDEDEPRNLGSTS